MVVHETLPLNDVSPGMRLARPVVDASGRLLVPAGGELSESLLRSLAQREIGELTIEREVEEDPAVRAAKQAALIAQADQLFRKAGDGPETRQLYRAILDFRLESGE